MLIQDMKPSELNALISRLDEVLHSYQQWHNALIRTLVCRLPWDKHDIATNVHEECIFGQWYYSNEAQIFTDNPGFMSIGEAHKAMHQTARNILINLGTSNIVTPLDYDTFANAIERLRLEIFTFKNELGLLLYTRDPLTMTINRISMLPILREQQEMVRRQDYSCCIAMMDLDSFKKINDEHGHLVGDKVLAAIARYLVKHLRPYDKVFRYGGEEFLICLQKIDLKQAYELLDRLGNEIAQTPIDVGLTEPLNMTVSFGLTMLDGELTIEQSIDRADKALYAAKASGKNRTQIWSLDIEQKDHN